MWLALDDWTTFPLGTEQLTLPAPHFFNKPGDYLTSSSTDYKVKASLLSKTLPGELRILNMPAHFNNSKVELDYFKFAMT